MKVPFKLFIGAVSQAGPTICGGIYMNMDERIRRINELYHQSQERELSEEERAE